jgi:hypothetical protein
MPGIEGLGCCCWCGESFVTEAILSLAGSSRGRVKSISLNIFEDDLCIHDKCLPELQAIMDTDKVGREVFDALPDASPMRHALKSEFEQEKATP